MILVITYAVFETAVSVLYLKDVIEPPASVWLYEEAVFGDSYTAAQFLGQN